MNREPYRYFYTILELDFQQETKSKHSSRQWHSLLFLLFIAKQLFKSLDKYTIKQAQRVILQDIYNMKSKLPTKSEQKEEMKQIVGLDLGNSSIRIAYNIKQIDLRTTLLVENNNVYINKRATAMCFSDFLMLLGKKYEDPSFQKVIKYYNYGFSKGTNQNILLQSNSKAFGEHFYYQLPVALLIKAFFLTNPSLKYLTLSQQSFRLVATLFEGKLNPYCQALGTCITLAGVSNFCLINSSVCLAANYLKMNAKERDDTEVICVIDFGSQGLTFSGFKLYHMQSGIVQSLFYEISPFGGTALTNCLVDYVTGQLVKEKGMDINKNSLLMHRMRLLCEEAKHTLSSNDHAFVRLDGLPDIVVYGCEVFLPQFDQCISQVIRYNIEMISNALKELQHKVSKIIVNGGSCRIPLFGKLLQKIVEKQKIVIADHDELRRGLLMMKTESVHVIDICPFSLRLEGDQKLKINLIRKGESIPLRKHQILKFPSGQLTQSLRFYQNDELVATCFIPQRPRENTFSLYVEVDHNKLLNIFATTSQGLIKMNCNMMELPREEYIRYQELINKADYHIEND